MQMPSINIQLYLDQPELITQSANYTCEWWLQWDMIDLVNKNASAYRLLSS